jgi:soluble lytic murein transglycosylase
LAEAHKYYERHTKAYPNNKTTHDILWYMAWVREENRNFDSAKELFRRLANQKPTGKNGEEAGFRIGLLDFRQKKYDSALDEFAKFRKKFPSSEFVSASLYWTARSHLAKKDTISAQKAIKTLNERYPLTYYDFRARQIFNDTAVAVLRIDDSLWHSRIDAIPIPETKDNSAKSPAYKLDNLLLGIFLGSIGLKDEAELLFEPIESRNSRNYPMVLSLARFYSKIGAHYRSYRLTRRLYWALPSNERGEFSPEYLELFYPTHAFAAEIDSSSAKFCVEPQLVRGVMRQESMFSPTILSPVGAMGLMQVMPYTGKEIAARLKVPFEQSKLLTPSVSVEFGTFYLNKRLNQFDGNFVFAIASYNGGSHNVKKWIDANKDVLDDEPFFVECIGFSETRKYVKLVLENYWVYKRM